MSAPRATSRSTSLVWSRRGWPGWRCSWWSRWPTWSSGDLSSSSPWSTGAGSGRTPRSRCLTRWRQSRTCNPPSSWSQGLSSCGLCPLLCQPTSLCCPPQGLQVGEVYDKVSETPQSWHSPATHRHQARHPRSPLLQLLSVLGQGDSACLTPRCQVVEVSGDDDDDDDDAGYVDWAKAVIAL